HPAAKIVGEVTYRFEKDIVIVAANLGCEQLKAIAHQVKNWFHLSRLLPRRIFETHERVLELGRAQSELRKLAIHLDTSIGHLFEQMHELAAVQFEWRAKASSNFSQWMPHPAERYLQAVRADSRSGRGRIPARLPAVEGTP